MNDLAAKSAKGAKKGEAWPMVRLGDVCEVTSGNSAPQDKSYFENGKYRIPSWMRNCNFREYKNFNNRTN